MKIKDLHNEAMRYLKNNFGTLLGVIILEGIVSSVLTGIVNQFQSVILQLLLSIVVYAITVPLSYGVVVSFIKVSRGEKIAAFDFVSDGMKSFKKVWAVFGRTILKLILPAILMVIAFVVSAVFQVASAFSSNLGEPSATTTILRVVFPILAIASTVFYTVKALLYSLTSYILFDNPEFTGKEVVEESARMMKGNRGKYFLLSLYLAALAMVIVIFGVAIPMLLQSVVAAILTIIVIIVGVVVLLPYAFAIQVAFYNLLKESLNGNSDPVNSAEE